MQPLFSLVELRLLLEVLKVDSHDMDWGPSISIHEKDKQKCIRLVKRAMQRLSNYKPIVLGVAQRD